ncbi:MAG: aldose 1-epimerase family protein [Anaerolineae bacterium]|nr:aldose 1-epimerase family protein [Anaerolineae bacterium]
MPFLYNRDYTPLELKQLAGDPSQLAGVRLVEYQEGRARGLRAAQVWTGSGLRFEILLDRGMDLGAAEHSGRALAFTYPTLATPSYHESAKFGWARTWGGGLMTTCGITHFGQPEDDNGEELGLHGRISHSPAEQVRVTTEWRGEDYVLEVEGRVRQSVIFGENLVLTRRITSSLGANSISVRDTVTNEGFRAAPHMILYHCNFGFPVVSPDSEVLLDETEVRPRDARAEKGFGQQTHFETPVLDYPEQVFFHKPRADANGMAKAKILNHALNFGAFINWKLDTLPFMGQWKLMQAGEYVCALEPANYWETPRAKLREQGRLKFLGPGESIRYALELGALV